jgi:hypothetical protein
MGRLEATGPIAAPMWPERFCIAGQAGRAEDLVGLLRAMDRGRGRSGHAELAENDLFAAKLRLVPG